MAESRTEGLQSRSRETGTRENQEREEPWSPAPLLPKPDRGSQYPDNVLVGGLLLCKRPVEIGKKIEAHAVNEVNQQMDAVDRNYFREQDPRMPMLKPERSTRITFGDG